MVTKIITLFLLVTILVGTIQFADAITSAASFVDDIKDPTSPFDTLDDAHYIAITTINEIPYALITSQTDDGVQIVDISDPYSPVPVSSFVDDNKDPTSPFDTLDYSNGIIITTINEIPYALITSVLDCGIQIVDISDPYSPVPVSSFVDDIKDSTSPFVALRYVNYIDTITIGGVPYALTTSIGDDGVQIINISDPYSPTHVASLIDDNKDPTSVFTALDGAYAVDTVIINGVPYALVASSYYDGVQIINISDPYSPTPTSIIIGNYILDDNGNTIDTLQLLYGLTIRTINGIPYALVVSNNNGLNIIDISDPSDPQFVTFVIDDGRFGISSPFDTLGGGYSVDTIIINKTLYALVTASDDDGVQIINISDPYSPTHVASIVDDYRDPTSPFDTLNYAWGITVTTINKTPYALVAAGVDDGVQIIDLTSLTLLPPGIIVLEESTTLPSVTTDDDTSNGGSGSQWDTRPTFGLDHKTFNQIVDGSFTFNNNTFTITDNWHTPFDRQNVTLGELNSFSAKVYADKLLKIQEFLFGIPDVGKAEHAELGIEVWYDITGNVTETKMIQKTNVIDPTSLNATSSKVSCQESDTSKSCYITTVSMVFLEPLHHDVMAIKAIDFEKRYHTTYLNEGFNIDGTSLNPMLQSNIAGTKKYEGSITITQTSKYSNIWVAEDGREFERNDSGTFTHTNKLYKRHVDSGEPKNRLHSDFKLIQQWDLKRAQATLAEICPKCNDTPYDKIDNIFTIELIPTHRSHDVSLQEWKNYEGIRAEYTLDKMIEERHSNNPFYKDFRK